MLLVGGGGLVLELPKLPALPGAHKLSVRDNNFLTVASGAFMELPELTILDLSHNQLTGKMHHRFSEEK